jgi:exo-1,4-beta-D-glucosaminidase
MDWGKRKDTVYTPQKDFADLTGLNSLPQIKLDMTSSSHREGGREIIAVNVKNATASVAFQVHLRVTKGKEGDDLVPIFWDDNYFSLLPGEEKSVTAAFDSGDADGKPPVLELDGYNITSATSNLAP